MNRTAQTDIPPLSRLTIRDIAKLAGVSIATVSRVLNGRGEVAPETRHAVERVVREYGYSPNRSARRLSSGRTGLVGVTLPLIAPSYFSVIVAGAAQALYELDLRIVLCPTEHKHDREISLLERLMHGTTDGGLLVLPEESDHELRTLRNYGYRFVVIDPLKPVGDEIAAVSAAHSAGAYQGVTHLIGLGHRRIGAITGPAGWVATEERLRGYHSALAGAGIQPDPALVTESNFEIEGGRSATARLLELPEPPTAIFAFNDNLAIGALHEARARGLRLPGQLSIVGFDDTGQASIVTPALTTLRQPLAEMGRMGVSLLARLLRDEHVDALHVELATRLVVRESTAAPRSR